MKQQIKKGPDPSEVVALRESVQRSKGLGITDAQEYCAASVYRTQRTWARWEQNGAEMDPAVFELAVLKLSK